jgi:hypothetical protein
VNDDEDDEEDFEDEDDDWTRCRGHWATVGYDEYFVCAPCGAWCEGPCTGITDAELRRCENSRGEPATAQHTDSPVHRER